MSQLGWHYIVYSHLISFFQAAEIHPRKNPAADNWLIYFSNNSRHYTRDFPLICIYVERPLIVQTYESPTLSVLQNFYCVWSSTGTSFRKIFICRSAQIEVTWSYARAFLTDFYAFAGKLSSHEWRVNCKNHQVGNWGQRACRQKEKCVELPK